MAAAAVFAGMEEIGQLLRRPDAQVRPAGRQPNGFNENLVLFSSGKCGMWVDATVAGMLYHGKDSKVADKTAFAPSPQQATDKGSTGCGSGRWPFRSPPSRRTPPKFAAWATSKEYINLVAKDSGWALVPGTRNSTYASAEYKKVSPFSDFVLDAIQTADANKPTLKPVPYTGVQFATIPEFQSIGTVTGQAMPVHWPARPRGRRAGCAGTGGADDAPGSLHQVSPPGCRQQPCCVRRRAATVMLS
jgi:ABC-type glycerol-3-phosphate transport system substrate-binding protein